MSPMTAAAFTWKRKVGQDVCKETVKAFNYDAYEEKDEAPIEDVTLHQVKRPKVIALEDKITKKKRLQDEGCILAENERYWEALKKWDEAIQMDLNDEKLYEMKAQVLLELNELFPAISAAEQAVKLNPCWWLAHQTLGRAQLGVGEVHMALKCFSKAFHIQPSDEQLQEDITWANSLLQKSSELGHEEKTRQPETEHELSIHEVTNLIDRRAITFEKNDDSATKDSTKVEPAPTSTTTDLSEANFILNKRNWIKFRK